MNDSLINAAGGGSAPGYVDEIPATQASLQSSYPSLAVAPDGSLFLADNRLRMVDTSGIIHAVAGDGSWCDLTSSSCGENGPALEASINPQSFAIGTDGSFYVSGGSYSTYRVLHGLRSLPAIGTGNFVISSADGSALFEFDHQGRHLRTLNPLTLAVLYQFAYTANGQLSSISDGDNNTTTIERDNQGTPLAIVGPFGQRTSLVLDANGYLASIADPEGHATAMTCTSDGLLQTFTDANGHKSAMAYDELGRLEKDQNAAGGFKELLKTGTDFDETVNLPLSTSWSGSINGSVSRTFNNNFWAASQSVNNGNTVNFTYDNDGLLTGAGTLSLTRSPQNGLLTGTSLGQVSDSWTYSSFGEATAYNANISGSSAFSETYTRDRLGRITDKSETLSGITTSYRYDYDEAGRLTDVQQNGVLSAHYEYDGNSDRTRAQYPLSGLDISGTYDDQDRMLSYGPNSYSYTANGELLSKATPGGTTNYVYDVLGNLRSVTLPDGTSIEYVIDGQDRRAGKKVNGVLSQGFLYDGQLQIVAELDGSGGIVSRFIYGDRSNVPSYMVKDGTTYRIIADQLGSPRLVVNTTDGTIVQRMDYDEFGNVLSDTNPGFQPFGFAGGLYDRDTNLVRFGVRDYDPESGRWAAKDPVLFSGWDPNLYGYVLNDPINFMDLAGLQLTDAQIANIIYNETRSLSGSNISQARENIANAIMNGDEALGNNRPRTASTTAHVPRGEQSTYAACQAAVTAARNSRAQGTDPTHGAMYFNFRNNNSTSNFFGESIQTQVGPLNNGYTGGGLNSTGVYANTYGGHR